MVASDIACQRVLPDSTGWSLSPRTPVGTPETDAYGHPISY